MTSLTLDLPSNWSRYLADCFLLFLAALVLVMALLLRIDRQRRLRAAIYRLVIHQSEFLFLLLDWRGRLRECNRLWAEYLGNEQVAKSLGSFLPDLGYWDEQTQERLREWMQRAQSGEAVQGELVVRDVEGQTRVCLAYLTPVHTWQERYLAIVAVDITARRRAELKEQSQAKRLARHRQRLVRLLRRLRDSQSELAQYRRQLEDLVVLRTAELLRAKEKAEAANQTKSVFLATMSHEIRTPLHAILGLTHLLRREVTEPKQQERLQQIEIAGNHLLSLINDVLDLSKIEAAKLELELTDFALSSVLDHTASLIQPAAEAKGLRVEIDAGDTPQWLRGDPLRLRQCLMNLASNAVKFTEKGWIAIRAKLLADEAEGLLIRFEVEDTGIGVSPERMSRLFQPFEQGDAGITRKFGGTGLGLALTRRLARLMGGDAGGESTLGQGSRFWFTARLYRGHGPMPIAQVSEVEGGLSAEEKLRQEYAGTSVLVVEDNEINRRIVVEMLYAVGLAVSEASDGNEALQLLAQRDFRLILMDVRMPGMDGLEATRQLRLNPRWRTVPVLAMTANVFPEERRACIDAGMNDFVFKPFEPRQLYAQLYKWLSAGGRQVGFVEPLSVPGGQKTFERPVTQVGTEPLAEIPGVNVEEGMRRSGNSWPMYRRLLRRLVNEHGDDDEKIRALWQSGQSQQAILLAHTVKGAAGNLGAVHLMKAAAELELTMRSGDTEQTLLALEGFSRALQALSEAIPQCLKEEPDQSHENVSALSLTQLQELAQLLADDDAAALTWLERHVQGLRATFPEHYTELSGAIERFDFPKAHRLLSGLIAAFSAKK